MRHFLAILLVALAACTTQPAPATPAAPAPLVLISIDGFRADYLKRGVSPNLSRLAAEGAHAVMHPSFPSLTFPNHYALVTGRRPDHNGMVNNRMEDTRLPGVVFTLSNVELGSNPIWWEDGTPLWVSAERQGIRTGTMFWPGSDFELRGVRPSQWRKYDEKMPDAERVDTLLSWLDLPEAQRPRFFTLYFDTVDSAGHRYGPHTPETDAALKEVDEQIGRLVAGFRARNIEPNIIIVGDHGMAPSPPAQMIELDAPADKAHVVSDGPTAGIAPLPGHEAEVEKALLGRSAHGECWRKEKVPTRFHYGTHKRVPAIVCLADIGWRYHSSQMPAYNGPPSLGSHGYDNMSPEMATNFIGYGPAFRAGVELSAFDNVSVYPLIAKLTGIRPEKNDGSLTDTARALRQAPN